MRLLLLIIGLLLWSVVQAQGAFWVSMGVSESGGTIPLSIKTDLIAYWDLDEILSTRYDSHTSSYHLSERSTTLSVYTGATDYMVDIPGDTLGHLRLNDSTSLNSEIAGLSDFTVSVWIRPDDLTSSGAEKTIFSNYDNDTGFLYFRLDKPSSVFVPEFIIGHQSGVQVHTFNSTISVNTLYHLVVVFDSGTLSLYVNNSLDSITKTGLDPLDSTVSTEYFRVGTNDGSLRFFYGAIGKLGLWGRALTATEISDLYNSGDGLLYSAL